MSLAAGATLMGRKQAEALMESTCTVRGVATLVLNESTGAYEETENVIYTGKCRLRFKSEQTTERGIAEQVVALQHPELSIPVGAAGSADVLPDHVVTIDSNPLDAGLVGRTFRVAGFHSQTHATARRFPLEVAS